MTLERVTITGVDDETDLLAMAQISREFPFVEWGILASLTRAATSRYPSADRRTEIYDRMNGAGAHFSLHLCGHLARSAMGGNLILATDFGFSQRVQVNGFVPGSSGIADFAKASPTIEIILQTRSGGDELDATVAVARSIITAGGRASVLFDPSGGRGRRPPYWATPRPGVPMGYAGGIGPDNVQSVLEILTQATTEPFWIDMESGVRAHRLHAPEGDDGKLDLGLVRRVLEQAAPFVKPGA